MGGFAVIVDRSGRAVEHDVIDRVRRSLEHRGPDGVGVVTRANVALVHAALHSTGESRWEHQPYGHDSGTLYVADVRIDNRRELATALAMPHHHTPSDMELLAEAHQRWQRGTAERVMGDFAFVAVAPDGSLQCFRDQMGVKPLYHWTSSRWIVVASELRQVTAHPDAPTEIDPGMAGQYLSGWVEDAVATVIRDVKRLPAAHAMDIGADSGATVRTWRYWTAAFDDPIVLADQRAYEEQFRELFSEAVRCRLRSNGPVAAQLSGGLDSSSIALMSARLVGPDGVQAYSCLFPETPGSDEQDFIDAAVTHGGLDWEPVTSDPTRPTWIDDDVAFWSDIPLPPDGPDRVALGRRARERGCRVVLTGHGGDQSMDSSHFVLADALQRRQFGLALGLARDLGGPGPGPTARTLLRSGLLAHRPPGLHRPGARRAPWVAGEARAAAGLDDRPVPGQVPRTHRSLAAHLHHQGEVGGYEAMTREVLDRTAARAGVEHRHPYLDRRLMEFACRIPSTVHSMPGRYRRLQREGLGDLLPPAIANRTSKASFRALWLRDIERHLPLEALAGSELVARGWVDEAEARTAYEGTRASIAAGTGGGNAFALWGLVQIEAMLRRR